MNSKKLVSAALTATTVLWMVAAAALLPVASAQTTSSLQAQIAALLAQIQTLQGQLNASGSTTTTSMTYDFTTDLTIGSKGAQVSALQQFLIAKGYLTAVSAPTGYFGALTQTALGKFQAANGISPTSGYFGPKTRAFINSMSSTTTTTGTGSTTTTTTAPATGLSVSLASTNPAAGSLISSANGSGGGSAARIPVLAFNLTAGNSGAVTVSGLTFQKSGVLSDSAIGGAYLIQNGQVVAQYNSLNSGLLSFSGLNLSIPAGQTQTFTLAIDVSAGLSAGNTTGFALTGVTSFDTNNNAITAAGSFPLTGNIFTVTQVSNPALATVTVTSTAIGTTVTAGTQGNIVGSWNFTVGTNPVWLKNINFHVIASANYANIQNVKLLVNGTQVGATLASVPANGMADFDMSAAPAKLNTGSNNLQVVADVAGSPNMYFQFEILNGYDVLAVDSQYNVPVAITNNGGTGTQVNIQAGQITVNQDANTPTGNIAKGQSGVVLAKYDIYAAGEPVKVKFLDFNILLNGANTSQTLANDIQNVSITDDAGNQVGTSINQPPSSNSCSGVAALTSGYTAITAGSNTTAIPAASTQYNDCFGSSGSPINYIVPANTTRVLSLKADIQSIASFSTITANLSGDTNNLQGMTSSKTASISGVSGVALTLVGSSLGVSQNNALGTQNVSAGTTNIRIGSYAFSASSAEGVNVNTLTVQLGSSTSAAAAFQNLKVLVNGTQFGTTQGVVSQGSQYSFSGSAFNIPAGQTVNVDVYADSLSAASGTYSPATVLTGLSGSGAVSFTSVSLANSVNGQNVSFNGQPALTIAADSSNPASGQIVQNSTGNTLAVFRFTETSNVENVKVTQLNVLDAVASSGVKAAFSNVKLYNGSTLLGTAASPVLDASGTGYLYVFNSFNTPLIVPQGSSVSLSLKGDAGSYTSGSLTDNTTSTFEIATSSDASNSTSSLTVVARGATSNKTAVTTLSSATGNPQTTLRSVESVSASSVSSLPPASFQQLGSITLTSNAAGDTVPNSLVLTFNGTAATGTFMNGIVLKDTNGNQITPSATSSAQITWNSGKLNPYVVTAGSSYTFTVWGDLSQIGSVPNAAQSLTAQIKNAGDFTYLDASTNGISVSLPTVAVPITVISLTSPVGGQF
jgi:hypothetical protein